MPNHVTTRCIVTGPAADIAAFRDRAIVNRADEGLSEPVTHLDFGKYIPRPTVLDSVEESTTSDYGARLIILAAQGSAPFETLGIYDNWIERFRAETGLSDAPMHQVAAAYLEAHPDFLAQGRARLQAIIETGCASWYPWNIKHWGTKWNSYAFRVVTEEPLEFLFETAWDFPQPVFEMIALEHPSLSFECLTFDEGWRFAGTGWFNPTPGKASFAKCDATEDLYERVYGYKPDADDEDA